MIKEIKGEAFRKMQLTELDMLVEFDKVCRKYNINYVLFGGSLLGAVRHQGYIPWDDDADIGMLREDYETFKRHKDEMNPNICFFQDHDTDHEYRWGYGKLRRTGSTYVRVGQEHLKCKTGILLMYSQWMIFRFQLVVKYFRICIAIVCGKFCGLRLQKKTRWDFGRYGLPSYQRFRQILLFMDMKNIQRKAEILRLIVFDA